jgi:hypothetical protein
MLLILMIIGFNRSMDSALRWPGYLREDSGNRWWQAGHIEGGVKYRTSGGRSNLIQGGFAKVGG